MTEQLLAQRPQTPEDFDPQVLEPTPDTILTDDATLSSMDIDRNDPLSLGIPQGESILTSATEGNASIYDELVAELGISPESPPVDPGQDPVTSPTPPPAAAPPWVRANSIEAAPPAPASSADKAPTPPTAPEISKEDEAMIDQIISGYSQHTSIRINDRDGDFINKWKKFDSTQTDVMGTWSKQHSMMEGFRGTDKDALAAPVETAAFTQATTKVYETEVVTPEIVRRFRRNIPAVTRQVPKGHEPVMIENSDGVPEQMFNVDYSFDGYGTHRLANMPEYQAANDVRNGASTQVRIQLPLSAAGQLYKAATANPNVMRIFADKLVINNYVKSAHLINEQLWYDTDGSLAAAGKGRGRAPYEKLPKGWTMTFITDRNRQNPQSPDPNYPQLLEFDIYRRSAPSMKSRQAV